jgi:Ser/Thr protein kinase RdoA (MazF antagonist)
MSSETSLTDQFFALTPERMLNAIESIGVRCTGRCLMLNSLENRVVEAEIEVREPVNSASEKFRVAKFYRPERWSEAQIQEEHNFLFELVAQEIPVVAPVKDASGRSVFQIPDVGIYYAVFAKERGRTPQELEPDQLAWLGRLLARMHEVGQSQEAKARIRLTPETYGTNSLKILLASEMLRPEFSSALRDRIESLVRSFTPLFKDVAAQRIHGDCHLGNIVWNDLGPKLVDFDDMVVGPVIQDIWLLLSGRDQAAREELEICLEGYEQFRPFPRKTIALIEPLRTLRIIHYAGWIAKRWADPIFQRTFPHFGSSNYWQELLQQLEEQERILQQDPRGGW